MNRYIFLIILNAFMSAFAQVLLKKAAIRNYSTVFRQYFNVYVISDIINNRDTTNNIMDNTLIGFFLLLEILIHKYAVINPYKIIIFNKLIIVV